MIRYGLPVAVGSLSGIVIALSFDHWSTAMWMAFLVGAINWIGGQVSAHALRDQDEANGERVRR